MLASRKVSGLFWILVSPKSQDKDSARREFILNVLLLASIILAFAASVYTWIGLLTTISPKSIQYQDSSLGVLLALCIFLFLYSLSRSGQFRLSAHLMIGIYFIGATYTAFRWGADVTQSLLTYSLIVVMSGILVNSLFAFSITIFIFLLIFILTYLQFSQILSFDHSWRNTLAKPGDAISYGLTLMVIATISWLFNRESEKALKRAQRSEAAVKRQRNKLEITVEKRTNELKQAQLEKVAQLYRFAELGRSASGLFHDLVNPLTLISLNLKSLSRQAKRPKLVDAKNALERAIIGTKRMESFIQAARKQIQDQEISQTFSLRDDTNQAIQMLEHIARKAHVTIFFQPNQNIKTFGNPIKFNQLITNLISNAIDAYDRVRRKNKLVQINIETNKKIITLTIQDWGQGIAVKNLTKIFDPLFTTKKADKGTGIGLSICKDIIEKDLKGTVHVESKKGVGTTFTITFPIKKFARLASQSKRAKS